jgi:hypothetical protein
LIDPLHHHTHATGTGKCIGQRNLKFFYMFITALTVHIL